MHLTDIYSHDYHLNQNLKHFHHLKKFPHDPLWFILSILLSPGNTWSDYLQKIVLNYLAMYEY